MACPVEFTSEKLAPGSPRSQLSAAWSHKVTIRCTVAVGAAVVTGATVVAGPAFGVAAAVVAGATVVAGPAFSVGEIVAAFTREGISSIKHVVSITSVAVT
jgi:hypothetical protein